MGKKILGQRRGRGTKVFRASLNRIAPARYPSLQPENVNVYKIEDLVHETGRGTPLVKLVPTEGNKKVVYLPATEGMSVGDIVEIGSKTNIKPGNVLALKDIPESALISNIELRPGDGGAMCRSSGGFGTLMSRSSNHAAIKLPSGIIKKVSLDCRATIGVVAGGGRTEKPFLKAGKKFKWKQSRAKLGKYPVVRGTAMNHHTHPFGGGSHKHPHFSTTTSRHAPPGRKVGLIAASRTGLRRGKIVKKQTE